MAAEAERLLRGSGWLPEVLRRADLAALDSDEIAAEPGEVDLPAFLTANARGHFRH